MYEPVRGENILYEVEKSLKAVEPVNAEAT